MMVALQVVLALAAIGCSAVVSHYIVLAFWNPKRFLAFFDELERNGRSMIYHVPLMVGWAAAAWLATRGMLYWIPDSIGSTGDSGDFMPLRDMLGGMVGLASLSLIEAVQTAAIDNVRRKELAAENREFLALLKNPQIAWAKATEFSERQKGARSAGDIDYRILHDVAGAFVRELENGGFRKPDSAAPESRDREESENEVTQTRLLEANRLRQVRRERAARSAAERAQSAAQRSQGVPGARRARAQIEFGPASQPGEQKSRALDELAEVVRASCNRRSYVPWDRSEHVPADGKYILAGSSVAKQWSLMTGEAERLLSLTDEDIANGSRGPAPIQKLVRSLPGVTVQEGCAILASYTGDMHGGRTEVFGEYRATKQPLKSVLQFDLSAASMVAGFFVSFQLPTIGIFWHGLYGYDYEFLFSDTALVTGIGKQVGSSADQVDLSRLDRPTGLRLHKNGDTYQMSCMAVFPNGSVVDFSLQFDAGRIGSETRHEVVGSSVRVRY